MTQLKEISSWNTCLFHFYKSFLTDFGGCFEFCKSIGIRQRVVLQENLVRIGSMRGVSTTPSVESLDIVFLLCLVEGGSTKKGL